MRGFLWFPGTWGRMNDNNNHKKSSLIVILNIAISPDFEPNPLIVSNHNLPRYSSQIPLCFGGFFRTLFQGKTWICLMDEHHIWIEYYWISPTGCHVGVKLLFVSLKDHLKVKKVSVCHVHGKATVLRKTLSSRYNIPHKHQHGRQLSTEQVLKSYTGADMNAYYQLKSWERRVSDSTRFQFSFLVSVKWDDVTYTRQRKKKMASIVFSW